MRGGRNRKNQISLPEGSRRVVLIAIQGEPSGPSTQRGVKIDVSLVPAFGSAPVPFLGSVQESAPMNTHRLTETGSNIAIHTVALIAGVILGVLLCLWGLVGRAATESCLCVFAGHRRLALRPAAH
jgi:hypothetical protein